jgi:hypothetical protein
MQYRKVRDLEKLCRILYKRRGIPNWKMNKCRKLTLKVIFVFCFFLNDVQGLALSNNRENERI